MKDPVEFNLNWVRGDKPRSVGALVAGRMVPVCLGTSAGRGR